MIKTPLEQEQDKVSHLRVARDLALRAMRYADTAMDPVFLDELANKLDTIIAIRFGPTEREKLYRDAQALRMKAKNERQYQHEKNTLSQFAAGEPVAINRGPDPSPIQPGAHGDSGVGPDY